MKKKLYGYFQNHIHFSKFLIVGSFNTGLDLILFFILANVIHYSPVRSSLISTGITMVISFYLNHRYVFISRKRKRQTIIQFFCVTALNVWLVQSLAIALVIKLLKDLGFFNSHIWTANLTAKLIGVGVSFMLNYVMYRYIFHSHRPSENVL